MMTHTFNDRLDLLLTARFHLGKALSRNERLLILKKNNSEQDPLPAFLDERQQELYYTMLLMGQKALFDEISSDELGLLLHQIDTIDQFYAPLGGVLGYHIEALKLFLGQDIKLDHKTSFSHPIGFRLDEQHSDTKTHVKAGIAAWSSVAEIYTVGGAGDRLNLLDPETLEPNPAAFLPFLGYTLLEGLFRDLEGREALFERTFGSKTLTPVILMTSFEKNNDQKIREFLSLHNYFGRPKHSIVLVPQPLAPVMNHEGDWIKQSPQTLLTKPGGHGVLWRILEQNHLFEWLEEWKRGWAIIRQINNPVSGMDDLILALLGIGSTEHKQFGFASCDRRVGAPEGMNILCQREVDGQLKAGISNIEYTDFIKWGIEDSPKRVDSPFSHYPSNTNILFVNLKSAQRAVKEIPFPGLILNVKNSYIDSKGKQVPCGRLEASMQNLADAFLDDASVYNEENGWRHLKTFILYNDRLKTISAIKKSSGNGWNETPESAFYDYLQVMAILFQNHCKMHLPNLPDPQHIRSNHPPFFVRFHPVLGPLFDDIGSKIQGGKLHDGAYVDLTIEHLQVKNLNVDGALIICAPLGSEASLSLVNVNVKNRGVDWESSGAAWEGKQLFHERLYIELQGNSRFEAKNLTISSDLHLVVPDGIMVQAVVKEGQIEFIETPLVTF